MICVDAFGLPPEYLNNFVLLAMAGYFTAIVRRSFDWNHSDFWNDRFSESTFVSTTISIVAYVTATLLKSEPIYESLLERILRRQGIQQPEATGEKILSEYVIMHGSPLANKKIADIPWPEHCLIVAVQNQGQEVIPRGDTLLRASDTIVILSEEHVFPKVHEEIEKTSAKNNKKLSPFHTYRKRVIHFIFRLRSLWAQSLKDALDKFAIIYNSSHSCWKGTAFSFIWYRSTRVWFLPRFPEVPEESSAESPPLLP